MPLTIFIVSPPPDLKSCSAGPALSKIPPANKIHSISNGPSFQNFHQYSRLPSSYEKELLCIDAQCLATGSCAETSREWAVVCGNNYPEVPGLSGGVPRGTIPGPLPSSVVHLRRRKTWCRLNLQHH